MEEKWLVIKEAPDYEVSSAGRVRSLKRGSVRILKTFNNLQGYPMVSLCVKGKPNTRTVHRLVAAAHVPNDFGLLEVNHIDGISLITIPPIWSGAAVDTISLTLISLG